MTVASSSLVDRWAQSLSPTGRTIALGFSLLLLCFTFIVILTFAALLIGDGGSSKPRVWVALALLLLLGAGLAPLSRRLFHLWQASGLSAYERRYQSMWAAMIAIGLLVGAAFGLVDVRGDRVDGLIGTGPVDPLLSLGLGVGALIALSLTMILYHRRIDDHEERAYLWASHIAFHFLAVATPVAWILGRGGWIEPLGATVAFALLFAALLIQILVWIGLKYR